MTTTDDRRATGWRHLSAERALHLGWLGGGFLLLPRVLGRGGYRSASSRGKDKSSTTPGVGPATICGSRATRTPPSRSRRAPPWPLRGPAAAHDTRARRRDHPRSR